MEKQVRVRFAPSPTGFLHVGGLRTALFNYLFARNKKGEFIIRIEDTDQARTVEGATQNIIETLKLFKLDYDGDIIFQSQRLEKYKKYAEELVQKGAAYYCFCTPERLEELRKQQSESFQPPKYDKKCLKLTKDEINAKLSSNEPHVIRLNVNVSDNEDAGRFIDKIHGEIAILSSYLDDQVLLKSDGFPTYHLANVVDDHEMGITDVIRGEEWIPSTPKHIILYAAFGWTPPNFAHLPLLLSKTKKKLSKRDGDVAVKDFLEQGYLPEALLNFVALLGWNPKTEQEIFSLDELIQQFDLNKVNKAGAVFDLDKLDWINGLYIRKLSAEELFERMKPFTPGLSMFSKDFLIKILKLEQGRLKKFSEIGERVRYFFDEPQYDPELLIWKKSEKTVIKENLKKLYEFLQTNEPKEDIIKKFVADNSLKNGEVLWPLRVALSGLEASPGPFEIMDAFLTLPNGKQIILDRVKKANELLA